MPSVYHRVTSTFGTLWVYSGLVGGPRSRAAVRGTTVRGSMSRYKAYRRVGGSGSTAGVNVFTEPVRGVPNC